MRFSLASGLAVCMAFALQIAANADFIVPSFRGSANSTYQEWNVFTSALGAPNTPDVASDNPNGTAQLVQTIPGAFVTSGGNIYSPGAPVSFDITVPDFDFGAGYRTTTILQIRTLGTLPDLSGATFNGRHPDSTELLFEQALSGFGGFLRDWRIQWNSTSGNIGQNSLSFFSVESSMSLDIVAIDTIAQPVPEPGSLALLLLASIPAGGLIRFRSAGWK